MRFLYHVTSYYNITIPSIQYYTDNEGLVTHINTFINADYNKPFNALQSEFDIIPTIISTIQDMKIKHLHNLLQIGHVKGHQDDETDYEDLSTQAKLNVQADKLAGDLIKQCNPIFIGPFIPSTNLQLIINGKEITSKIAQTIRYEYGFQALHDHILSDTGWHEDTFHKVNWETHRIAHQREQKFQHFNIKFCHNVLPLAYTMHRRDPKHSNKCP